MASPGDMLEISRPDHQHWALYMGDGYVVHLSLNGDKTAGDYLRSFYSSNTKSVVKRELLEDVVGGCHCQVNNHLDRKFKPQKVCYILNSACEKIGMELKHTVQDKGCEHFVIYLRYALDHNRQFPNDPKPGDLIQIFRYFYQHWAVYVGGGYVVHLTSSDETTGGFASLSFSSTNSVAMVRQQHLKDVVDGFPYCINNYLDNKYRPRPVEQILDDAEKMTGQRTKYDYWSNNCEHFATSLRYGEKHSEQAKSEIVPWLVTKNFGNYLYMSTFGKVNQQ